MGESETTRLLALWDTGNATFSVPAGKSAQIGRGAACEINLALPSVSRRHAVFTVVSATAPRQGELATIEDVGGLNGVMVSGDRIAVQAPYPVAAGDIIELGGAFFFLHPPSSGDTGLSGAVARVSQRRPAGDDTMVDRLIDVLGRANLPLLILGAKGTGKTFFASAVHERSGRGDGSLVSFACGGASPAMVLGALAAARGGTLLLEEVFNLPAPAQAALAAGLGAGGAGVPSEAGARVIATTQRPLTPLVESGAFLWDLHVRLAGVNVLIPQLRERAGELSRFAARFLAAVTSPGRRPPRLSSEALRVLVRHPFPGNLRELRETMERASRLATVGFVGPEHLKLDAAPTEPPPQVVSRRFEPVTRRFGPITPTEPPDAPTEEIEVVVPPPAPTPQRLPSSRKKKRT